MDTNTGFLVSTDTSFQGQVKENKIKKKFIQIKHSKLLVPLYLGNTLICHLFVNGKDVSNKSTLFQS